MKQIPNFDNYAITEAGEIYHNKRGLKKWSINNAGYAVVTLTNTDPQIRPRQKTFTISRLVAEAYILNPERYKEINHKDGNKLNNHVSNLEWCSRRQNIMHSITNGLRKNLRPVTIGGKHYSTIRSAMKETGLTYNRIIKMQNCCKNKFDETIA
jgi:hypothetical protein